MEIIAIFREKFRSEILHALNHTPNNYWLQSNFAGLPPSIAMVFIGQLRPTPAFPDPTTVQTSICTRVPSRADRSGKDHNYGLHEVVRHQGGWRILPILGIVLDHYGFNALPPVAVEEMQIADKREEYRSREMCKMYGRLILPS